MYWQLVQGVTRPSAYGGWVRLQWRAGIQDGWILFLLLIHSFDYFISVV